MRNWISRIFKASPNKKQKKFMFGNLMELYMSQGFTFCFKIWFLRYIIFKRCRFLCRFLYATLMFIREHLPHRFFPSLFLSWTLSLLYMYACVYTYICKFFKVQMAPMYKGLMISDLPQNQPFDLFSIFFIG